MSIIKAKITKIESIDSLHAIECIFENTHISLVTLEISNDIKIGRDIKLSVKPTHIAVGKTNASLSIQNQIPGTIENISQGKILSHLDLKTKSGFHLESIITTDSLMALGFKKDDAIIIYMNPTDVSVVGVCND